MLICCLEEDVAIQIRAIVDTSLKRQDGYTPHASFGTEMSQARFITFSLFINKLLTIKNLKLTIYFNNLTV